MMNVSFFRNRAGAFTLLEVMIGMTILALVSGMIYGVLRMSVQTVADMEAEERQDRAIHHFIGLCRETLETLPVDAVLTAEIVEEGTPPIQELTLQNVPGAFSFGEDPVFSSDLVIRLRPNEEAEDPIFQVAISREDFTPESEDGDFAIRKGVEDEFFQQDEEGRYWLDLLPNIAGMQWGFWNEEEETWEDYWEDEASLPLMVQLELRPHGRSAPVRMVFDLPEAAATTGASSGTGQDDSESGSAAANTDGGGAPGSGARPQRPGGGGDAGPGGRPGRGGGGDRARPRPGGGEGRPGGPPGGGRPGGPGPEGGGGAQPGGGGNAGR